jgi:hypothetical protein
MRAGKTKPFSHGDWRAVIELWKANVSHKAILKVAGHLKGHFGLCKDHNHTRLTKKFSLFVRLVKDVETGEDLAVKLEPQLAKGEFHSQPSPDQLRNFPEMRILIAVSVKFIWKKYLLKHL